MPKEQEFDEEGNEVEPSDIKIVDPGQFEGVKKDPKTQQDNITEDHPKYSKVYGRMKRAEREIEELKKASKGGNDNSELMQEMRRHNTSLEETIKTLSKDKSEESDNDAIVKLESNLSELKILKKTAREDTDFDAETKLDDTISDLKADIRDLKRAHVNKKKEINADKDKDKDKEIDAMSADDEADFKMWVADNEWFTKNSRKRATAIAFEKQIVKEDDFKDGTLLEVLEEVKIRVEEKFKPVKGKNTVETGGRMGSGSDATGTVKLSAAELEIANGLGITPIKYAKQKSFIDGRKA